MNNLPKFLVIRFPIGGAGNFLSSTLQCSNGVGHWLEFLEINKSNNNWVDYFKKVFTSNLERWVENEPISKHQLGTREIFSANYSRGNNLTLDEFFALEKQYCTDYYFSLKRENKFIPIFWHKQFNPVYFNKAMFIDVFLDKDSLSWYDRAYFRKHFSVTKQISNILVTNNAHRPSIIPKTFTGQNLYQEEYNSFYSFAKKNIFNNPMRSLYQDDNIFTNKNQPNMKIWLSDLIDHDRFISVYPKLCNFLDVKPIDIGIIKQLHLHWISCHVNK
jgi:hypothetical protein